VARRPDLSKIEQLLDNANTTICLTDAQYEDYTGRALPKDRRYLEKRSALAHKCEEKGFTVSVIEKQVILSKKED